MDHVFHHRELQFLPEAALSLLSSESAADFRYHPNPVHVIYLFHVTKALMMANELIISCNSNVILPVVKLCFNEWIL